MLPPFKKLFQKKIGLKKTEKEIDILKRFIFQENIYPKIWVKPIKYLEIKILKNLT